MYQTKKNPDFKGPKKRLDVFRSIHLELGSKIGKRKRYEIIGTIPTIAEIGAMINMCFFTVNNNPFNPKIAFRSKSISSILQKTNTIKYFGDHGYFIPLRPVVRYREEIIKERKLRGNRKTLVDRKKNYRKRKQIDLLCAKANYKIYINGYRKPLLNVWEYMEKHKIPFSKYPPRKMILVNQTIAKLKEKFARMEEKGKKPYEVILLNGHPVILEDDPRFTD